MCCVYERCFGMRSRRGVGDGVLLVQVIGFLTSSLDDFRAKVVHPFLQVCDPWFLLTTTQRLFLYGILGGNVRKVVLVACSLYLDKWFVTVFRTALVSASRVRGEIPSGRTAGTSLHRQTGVLWCHRVSGEVQKVRMSAWG